MVQDGTFGLGSLLERARGTSLGEGRTDQGDPCAGKTTLVCSRPEAAASVAPLDRNGIIGGVCRHGIPLRGCFTDLRTAEQFSYYLIIIADILRAMGGSLPPGFPSTSMSTLAAG